MSDYRIFQAQILAKDPTTPRQYSVVEIPNGQKLVGVQIGNALKDQSAPLLGSIVLVLQLDAYRSYILMVLREPFSFLSTNNQYRGFIPSTGNVSQDISIGANPVQDGEIFMEATGPTSPTGEGIPGFGAHLYLGNNGVAQIESGSMGERLLIGGEGSSDDHEVILSADNGYFESNTGSDNIQSTFNYTTSTTTGLTEGLQVAVQTSIPTGLVTVETPISELTMDTLGNTVLRNTTGLLDKSFLKLNTTSDVQLGNLLSSVHLDPTGNISVTGTTINLNNGVQPIARVNDSTFSSIAQDPEFWNFIQTLFIIFNVHTHVSAAPGQPTSPPVTPLTTYPTQMSGIVSSGSPTVKAG